MREKINVKWDKVYWDIARVGLLSSMYLGGNLGRRLEGLCVSHKILSQKGKIWLYRRETWAYDPRILKMQIDGGHVVSCGQWTVSTSANERPWRYMWPLSHLFSFWGEHRARRWIKWHAIKEICLQSRSVILESQQTYSGPCLNDEETLYTKSLRFGIASYRSIHLA